MKVDLYLPTKTVDNELIIGKNPREIIFKVIGGHTECSSIVYSLSKDVLFIGDNFAADLENRGCFLNHFSEKAISILKQLEQLSIREIIPGSGPKTNLVFLAQVRQYFEELFRVLRSLKEEGRPSKNVALDPKIPEPGSIFTSNKPDDWEELIESFYDKI